MNNLIGAALKSNHVVWSYCDMLYHEVIVDGPVATVNIKDSCLINVNNQLWCVGYFPWVLSLGCSQLLVLILNKNT